jgi:hypothetical protein
VSANAVSNPTRQGLPFSGVVGCVQITALRHTAKKSPICVVAIAIAPN